MHWTVETHSLRPVFSTPVHVTVLQTIHRFDTDSFFKDFLMSYAAKRFFLSLPVNVEQQHTYVEIN